MITMALIMAMNKAIRMSIEARLFAEPSERENRMLEDRPTAPDVSE